MGKIFVVGDVHGNYPKLMSSLQSAGYETGDDLIFVGDLMDRGSYNGKVARFVEKLGEHGHVIQGNHEFQHKQMFPFYEAVVSAGKEYSSMVSDIFKYYKQGATWPIGKEDCEKYRCSLDERKAIIAVPGTDFESCIKRVVVYTMAWEDTSLWHIVSEILDSMCGDPYNAEHTLYEFFRESDKTREAMKNIWFSSNQEFCVKFQGKGQFQEAVITHNNPFGYSIRSIDPDAGKPGHKDILYLFGHIPVEEITVFDESRGGCRYIDLDLSPKKVGIVRIG